MAETSTLSQTQRDRYERLRAQLWTIRSPFDGQWRDIAKYVQPASVRFNATDKNRGDATTKPIINSTATFASQTLESGLQAGLTSPARPWVNIQTADPELNRIPAVKAWLREVTERFQTACQLSNFYTAVPTVYGDVNNFGTAAMGVLEDPGTPGGEPGDLFRCFPYPLGSYALGVDNRGLVTTFVRDYSKTVGQLIDEFGGVDGQPRRRVDDPIDWSRFSTDVRNAYERNDYEREVSVCWVVTPNRDHQPDTIGPSGFPWVSCHFERGSNRGGQVLRTGGYYEFPVMAPRWYVGAEETYGSRCPGMTAIGDIKSLQIQEKKKAQAIEKMINPPLNVPTGLRNQAPSLLPGGTNYTDDQKGVRPVHDVTPDIGAMVADMQQVEGRILRAYYYDLIRMLGFSDAQRGSQPPTAREVDERHEEKLLAFGPVLERLADDLLDPFFDRVYGIMLRAGGIPPAPPELEGVKLTPQYTSIMALAQKLIGIVGLDRFVQTVSAIAATMPRVLAYVNDVELVKEYHDVTGVSPRLLRSDKEAQAILDADAQAAQQAQQMAQMSVGAKSARDLSQAPVTGDNALASLIQGATG